MTITKNDKDNLFYPPGGILLWIIITIEIVTFLIACIFFFLEKRNHWELFVEMQKQLNLMIGTANTIVLISSGYCIANSVVSFKNNVRKQSSKFLLISFLLGIAFLVLKSLEYYTKIQAGYTLGYNSFFTFYWLLTGFHFIHVFVGVAILIYLYQTLPKEDLAQTDFLEHLESGASFWHLCDLIWIFLFPTLYLLR